MTKMTKVAVTLAAMSAMTVASASMAFAAIGEYSSTNVVAEDTVVTGAGKWSGDDQNGWSFTPDGGSKLKDTWAQIDGVYYYFKGDKALQDAVEYIDGQTYYFDATGRLATGWQKITSKMDAYSDIEIPDILYYSTANSYVDVNDAYDYEDFVWCYFHEDGHAAENEWFQSPESGLWYYFDENVMIKNIYNYPINPVNNDVADSENTFLYGFNEDGAMLVGWNYSKPQTTWNDPTADKNGKRWYYYNENGKMQETGWKQIDGKWYLFADYNAYSVSSNDGVGDRNEDWRVGGYPLIVKSYVASFNKRNGEYEYFYVNDKGEMATGVTTVPKDAYRVLFYQEDKDVVVKEAKKVGTAVDVNFNSSKGKAEQAVIGDRFYTMKTAGIVKASFDSSKSAYISKVNNTVLNASDFFAARTGNTYAPAAYGWTWTNGSVYTDTADVTLDYTAAAKRVSAADEAVDAAKIAVVRRTAELDLANLELTTAQNNLSAYNASDYATADAATKALDKLTDAVADAQDAVNEATDALADANNDIVSANAEKAAADAALARIDSLATSIGAVTGSGAYADIYDNDGAAYDVKGELVKASFVAQNNSTLYLADSNGDFVTSKAIVIDEAAAYRVNDDVYNVAYVLLGANGKALTGYEGSKKTVNIGGVSYWASDLTLDVATSDGKTVSATIFFSNKKVDINGNGFATER